MARVRIEVRLLPEPGLWAWELREVDSGRLVASSWLEEWAAFASPAAAHAAALERLRPDDLTPEVPGRPDAA